MIQITLKKGVLEALVPFTKSGPGHAPANALHVLKRDDMSLLFGATDKSLLGVLRLVAGEGELLDEFCWTDDEDPVLSLLVSEKAVSAWVKSQPEAMLLTVFQTYAELRAAGEEGDRPGLQLPRIRCLNSNVFTSLRDMPAATVEDVTARGQLVVPVGAAKTISSAAKALGINKPGELQFAQFRGAFGVTLSGSPDLWCLLPCETVVTSQDAGLPPYWVTGDAPTGDEDRRFGTALTDFLSRDKGEQQTLKFGEDGTVERIALRWSVDDDAADDVRVWSAPSSLHDDGDPLLYRLKISGHAFVLSSDTELLIPGDEHERFDSLDDGKSFCELREAQAVNVARAEEVALANPDPLDTLPGVTVPDDEDDQVDGDDE